MSKKVAVGYDTLLAQAKEQRISPVEFIAKLDKESYDQVIVEKNIKRFTEDITDVIRKKERDVEDLKDSIPELLRDMPSTSGGRLDLVKAITMRMGQIESFEIEIESLEGFQELFLLVPEA